MRIVRAERSELWSCKPQSACPACPARCAVVRFCRPSDFSLSEAELHAHALQLRRSGWQPWEIRVRFGIRDAA
jgi:hypothetical protein